MLVTPNTQQRQAGGSPHQRGARRDGGVLNTREMWDVMPPRQTFIVPRWVLPATWTEARTPQFELKAVLEGLGLAWCRSGWGVLRA